MPEKPLEPLANKRFSAHLSSACHVTTFCHGKCYMSRTLY